MIRNPIDDKLDIIVLAGQSNAESSGEGPVDREWQLNPDILMLKGDYFASVTKAVYGNDYLSLDLEKEYYIEVAKERYHDGKIYGVLGLPFARNYFENDLEKGRKILIIYTPIGGTGFAKGHWGLKDSLYLRMLDMIKKALAMNSENRVKAIVWHQGEHDAFEPPEMDRDQRYLTYKNNLTALVKGVREVAGQVPFITAGFTKYWVADFPVQCEAVLTATKDVCATLPQMAYIETSDLLANCDVVEGGDSVHFCKQSINVLGDRYYNEYKKIIAKRG